MCPDIIPALTGGDINKSNTFLLYRIQIICRKRVTNVNNTDTQLFHTGKDKLSNT
jgi:hypothetical protein